MPSCSVKEMAAPPPPPPAVVSTYPHPPSWFRSAARLAPPQPPAAGVDGDGALTVFGVEFDVAAPLQRPLEADGRAALFDLQLMPAAPCLLQLCRALLFGYAHLLTLLGTIRVADAKGDTEGGGWALGVARLDALLVNMLYLTNGFRRLEARDVAVGALQRQARRRRRQAARCRRCRDSGEMMPVFLCFSISSVSVVSSSAIVVWC